MAMASVTRVLRWLSGRSVVLLAAGWLVCVGLMAATVAYAQGQSRAALEARFVDRAETAADFVSAYARELVERQAEIAGEHLMAEEVSAPDFADVVSDTGMEAAVLLDARGRALSVAPARPSLIGRDLARRYPHLLRAVAGRPAI